MEFVTVGKLTVCRSCGKKFGKGTQMVNYGVGGRKRCVCPQCLEVVPNGNAILGEETGNGSKRGKTRTMSHKIQVVATNPATVLELKVAHGFSSELLENGDYRCEYDKMTTCHKGGWLFDHNGNLKDEYQMMFVNGKPVHNVHEYHDIVDAQDWYERVGE